MHADLSANSAHCVHKPLLLVSRGASAAEIDAQDRSRHFKFLGVAAQEMLHIPQHFYARLCQGVTVSCRKQLFFEWAPRISSQLLRIVVLVAF